MRCRVDGLLVFFLLALALCSLMLLGATFGTHALRQLLFHY